MTITGRFRSVWFGLLLVAALVTVGCLGGGSKGPKEYTLTMEIEGEGTTKPKVGTHKISKDSVVDLSAEPAEEWEFYAWTGESTKDVDDPWQANAKLRVNSDKHIVAFFAKEYFEFELEENHFMGSGGSAKDLTNKAPYPPGFEIRLKAEPDFEDDEFLHWSVYFPTSGMSGLASSTSDPRNYFGNYEEEETTFTVPNQAAIVTAHFTKRSKPIEEGNFDFYPESFGRRIVGDVGVTYHYWDLSSLETGTQVDFSFHARNLPDRFNVYYGTWADVLGVPGPQGEIFASGWVSRDPSGYTDFSVYPEGIQLHDWHPEVEPWNSYPLAFGPGGKYSKLITKEEGKDVLLVKVEGRDGRTIWDYQLELSQ